jgi:hypothetical protein
MEKVALLCILLTIISLCADWSPADRKRANMRNPQARG